MNWIASVYGVLLSPHSSFGRFGACITDSRSHAVLNDRGHAVTISFNSAQIWDACVCECILCLVLRIIIVMSQRLSFYDLWTWQWCNVSCMTTQPCRPSTLLTLSTIWWIHFVHFGNSKKLFCSNPIYDVCTMHNVNNVSQQIPNTTELYLLWNLINNARTALPQTSYVWLNEEQKKFRPSDVFVNWMIFVVSLFKFAGEPGLLLHI